MLPRALLAWLGALIAALSGAVGATSLDPTPPPFASVLGTAIRDQLYASLNSDAALSSFYGSTTAAAADKYKVTIHYTSASGVNKTGILQVDDWNLLASHFHDTVCSSQACGRLHSSGDPVNNDTGTSYDTWDTTYKQKFTGGVSQFYPDAPAYQFAYTHVCYLTDSIYVRYGSFHDPSANFWMSSIDFHSGSYQEDWGAQGTRDQANVPIPNYFNNVNGSTICRQADLGAYANGYYWQLDMGVPAPHSDAFKGFAIAGMEIFAHLDRTNYVAAHTGQLPSGISWNQAPTDWQTDFAGGVTPGTGGSGGTGGTGSTTPTAPCTTAGGTTSGNPYDCAPKDTTGSNCSVIDIICTLKYLFIPKSNPFDQLTNDLKNRVPFSVITAFFNQDANSSCNFPVTIPYLGHQYTMNIEYCIWMNQNFYNVLQLFGSIIAVFALARIARFT